MMRFIPEWERPPEPDMNADFKAWADWQLTYRAPNCEPGTKAAILAMIDRVQAQMKERA